MNARETIGTFTLIKNEIPWIAGHLENALPEVDQMVFLEGNSTDGTLEAIKEAKSGKYGDRITLIENADPKDLQDDYVRLFNVALGLLKTDWGWFLHPDMMIEVPGQVRNFLSDSHGQISAFTHIRSVAGEPGADLLEIAKGRVKRWKNIYRLRNPNLGAHYHGWYGAWNEDVFFSDITGDEHIFHDDHFERYPYDVVDSGISTAHFSDVRPYKRRLSRMVSCMSNQGKETAFIRDAAARHPRVTLKDGQDNGLNDFKFIPYTGKCHGLQWRLSCLS